MSEVIRFTITDEEHEMLSTAMRPVPAIMIGGMMPSSPQDNANHAWQALGKAYGVEWMTIRPFGPEPIPHEFTGEKSPTPLETRIDERGNSVQVDPEQNPERLAYLDTLTEARVIADDGGAIDYPVFQCADPRCAGREYGAAEFVAHYTSDQHPADRRIILDVETGKWLLGSASIIGEEGARLAASLLPGMTAEAVEAAYKAFMEDDQ